MQDLLLSIFHKWVHVANSYQNDIYSQKLLFKKIKANFSK